MKIQKSLPSSNSSEDSPNWKVLIRKPQRICREKKKKKNYDIWKELALLLLFTSKNRKMMHRKKKRSLPNSTLSNILKRACLALSPYRNNLKKDHAALKQKSLPSSDEMLWKLKPQWKSLKKVKPRVKIFCKPFATVQNLHGNYNTKTIKTKGS